MIVDWRVMPLSPQLLFERHPELFPSENAAKKAVSRFKKAASNKNTKSDKLYLYILNRKCHFLRYCVGNARGRHKTALVPGNFDAHEVQSTLEELHDASVRLIDADKVQREVQRKVPPKIPHRSSASGHRVSPSASRRSQGTRRPPKLRLRKRGSKAATR